MRSCLIFLSTFLLATPCSSANIVFAVSTGSAMPMTQFGAVVGPDQLTGGLLKDFGDALARELGMRAHYLTLPRKRVEAALLEGRADLLCDLRPEWVDSKGWMWSETVFSNHMIVASRIDTPPLARLQDLAGQRVGTVLGYRYPEVERQLGRAAFSRDDAVSDDVTTNKLLGGRFRFMMSNALYYNYQRKVHPGGAQLNPAVFTVRPFDTYCALPPNGRLDIVQVNRAILALRRRGDMQRIGDRYRPPH